MSLSLDEVRGLLRDSRTERERIAEKRQKWADRAGANTVEIRRLEAEVQRLSLPPEPLAEGSIVKFRKSFVGGTRVFSYASIRTNGRWYTTGSRAPQSITWEQLCAFVKNENVLFNETPREIDAPPPF